MRHVFLFFLCLAPSAQALTISDQTNGQPKQLVIVRSHNPHSHMLMAMLSYFADIKENMTDSRFLVSVDTTNTVGAGAHPEAQKSIVDKIKMFLPEAEMHIYDNTSVAGAYKGIPVNGYNWHVEPLNLARKYAVDHFGMVFDYIWAVEDDVLVCGGFTKVMARYAGNNADVLAGMPGPGNVEGWPLLDRGTQKFLERYPVSKRRHGFEQIMRFSNKLLDRLHDLAYNEGVSALSEMFPFTVAFNENYKIDTGLLDIFGKFSWQSPFRNDEGSHLCDIAQREGRVTINHPFKARLQA